MFTMQNDFYSGPEKELINSLKNSKT